MRMCQVFIFLKSRYLSVSCCLRNDYIFYNFFYRKNTISITLQISVHIYKACKEQDDLTEQTLLFFSFLCFFFIGAHQCMYQASLNKKKYDKYKNSYDLGPDHPACYGKEATCYFLLVIYSLLFEKIVYFVLVILTNNKQKLDYFPN